MERRAAWPQVSGLGGLLVWECAGELARDEDHRPSLVVLQNPDPAILLKAGQGIFRGVKAAQGSFLCTA